VTIRRIKATEIPALRLKLIEEQDGKCLLCGKKFFARMPLDPVLDHCHKTGAIRGVLHRGCNSLLGKFENYAPRAWLRHDDMPVVAAGMADYLMSESPRPMKQHPLHRSAEEKAVSAKVRRARRTRKTK
jgi:hypothetical protein